MSEPEIAALVIAAALGGVGTGLGIAAMVMLKRANNNATPHKAIDAYARWLAARKRFTRATATFVESFRALTKSESQSQSVAARRAEANQARDDWRNAATELDTAEAEMIAWSIDPSITSRLIDHARPASDTIRTAIDADAENAQRFYDSLEARDRLATESLRPATNRPSSLRTGSQFVIRFLRGVIACLDDIASRWARR